MPSVPVPDPARTEPSDAPSASSAEKRAAM